MRYEIRNTKSGEVITLSKIEKKDSTFEFDLDKNVAKAKTLKESEKQDYTVYFLKPVHETGMNNDNNKNQEGWF